jgi:hypothetical protein
MLRDSERRLNLSRDLIHAITITTFRRPGSVIGPSALKHRRAARRELAQSMGPSVPRGGGAPGEKGAGTPLCECGPAVAGELRRLRLRGAAHGFERAVVTRSANA